MKHLHMRRQAGASLIEILVTILILSFGMLALSGMMAYAVQMPKLSAYRATAVMLATSHVERMRANVDGFIGGSYDETMTYKQTVTNTVPCAYPSCSAANIAAADKNEMNNIVRRELPEGGVRMVCMSVDGAEQARKVFKSKMIKGDVTRTKFRPVSSIW